MVTPLVDAFDEPRLSHDGTLIAFRRQDQDLWIWDLEHSRETRLTDADGGVYPAWTPEDTLVTFSSTSGLGLFSRPADRSGPTETILPAEFLGAPGSWTPDGQTLIYYAQDSEGDRDLWTLPVDGDPVPFLTTEFNEKAPRLSPNGRWVAYVSDQPGEERVFVKAFPEGGAEHPVSTGTGTEPVWSRDGTELFYRNGNQMWVVEVETGSPCFGPDSLT